MPTRNQMEADKRKKLSELSGLEIHVQTLANELQYVERLNSDNAAVISEFKSLLSGAVDRPVVGLLEVKGLRQTIKDINIDVAKVRAEMATKKKEIQTAQSRLDALKQQISNIDAELQSAGSIITWKI